jgi:hypothetical protein
MDNHQAEQQPQQGDWPRGYAPLHPDLYTYSEAFIEPALLAALREGTQDAILGVMDCPVFGVFKFACLRRDFCARLIQELDHLERSGVEMARPNSMNRYGAILDKCGFKNLMDDICARIISPIADILFAPLPTTTASASCAPSAVEDASSSSSKGLGLRYHHAFTVRYAPTQDKKLDKHVDNADITLNVCLGREGFKGGHLLFQGGRDSAVVRLPRTLHRYAAEEQEHRVDHEIGTGLIHLGSHIHQAVKLEAGERINLIVWSKALPFE